MADTQQTIQTQTDEEVAILARTHKEAFGILIGRYQMRLSRYIKRLGVYVPEDIEDLLQTIFIKTYRNLNDFDPSLSFSSWIYRITHNETMSFYRARRSRPEGNLVDDGEEMLRLIADDTNGFESADQTINAQHLKIALAKIDQKYRDVLVLRFFEERDYSEISDILRIPSGTVATLIHRAKKQLQRELKHIFI